MTTHPRRYVLSLGAVLVLMFVTVTDVNAKRRGCQPGGDCKNGFGDMYYTDVARDGDHYLGGHKNGLRHGFGSYHWWRDKKGQVLEGEWAQDQPVGEVLVRYADGSRYKGGWKMPEGRHGVGKYMLADGSYWLAEWSRDRKQGYAIYYDAFSDVVQESYFHGKMGSRQPRLIDPAIFDEREVEVRADDYPATSEKKSPTVSAQESASSNVEADASVRSAEKNKKVTAFFKED